MVTKRYSITTAILLLAGVMVVQVAVAAMSGEEIELQKKQVIRESLQKLGRPTENAALLAAAPQAQALLEIKLDRAARETRVSIQTSGEPAYEVFNLQGGQRIAIDLYNTVNLHSGETYEAEQPSVVKLVRTSLFQLEPQFISRVVLDFKKAVKVQVAQKERTIEIAVPEDAEMTAVAPAPAVQKPAEPTKPVAQVKPVEAPKPAPAVQKPAEPKPPVVQAKPVEAPKPAPVQVAQKVEPAAPAVQKPAEPKPVVQVKPAEAPKPAPVQVAQKVEPAAPAVQKPVEPKPVVQVKPVEAPTPAPVQVAQKVEPAAPAVQKPVEPKPVVQAKPVEAPKPVAAKPQPEQQQVTGRAARVRTDERVTLNFRDADLSAVLDLLARKANINLMAGADVTGKVTARLVDVPLMKAMELVLRENGYALAREDSIYRVLPLKVAEELGLATSTETFKLEYAKASDVAAVLKDIVTAKGKVVASDSANVVIVSDFPDNMRKVADVIRELDVAQTIIATTTGMFRLSYLEAMPTAKILEKMVGENGSIIADQTTNSIILTETPGSFQVISDLISELDHKPGQVYISVLMVDAVLSDDSEFGVDWLAKAFKEGSVNQGVRQADFDTTLGNVGTEALNAGVMTLGVLSGRFDLQATIAAEVQSRDATILADPRILVVNNETAKIEIVTEVPFQEITQSTQGPPVASTEFKDIGVMLDVTPRITHEDTVLLRLRPEESSITGYTDSGIPIEDSRRADTTILLNDGQTVVVGGLRNISHSRTVTRVPWLSEIPVLGALFRNTITKRANTELLVFLTVHIVKDAPPELTAHERAKFDQIELEPKVPDGTRELWDDIRHPWGKREPIWKRQERVR